MDYSTKKALVNALQNEMNIKKDTGKSRFDAGTGTVYCNGESFQLQEIKRIKDRIINFSNQVAQPVDVRKDCNVVVAILDIYIEQIEKKDK